MSSVAADAGEDSTAVGPQHGPTPSGVESYVEGGATDAPAYSPNRAALVAGLELVRALVALRQGRRSGQVPGAERLSWSAQRRGWWQRQLDGAEAGSFMPLVALQRQLSLADAEVDLLLVALAPEIDPEILEEFGASRATYYFRGVDVELALGLLHDTPGERLVARALLAPDAPLVRHGVLRLVPIAHALSPHEVEVRPTPTLVNFVLERSLLTGPMAQLCELTAPERQWDHVILETLAKTPGAAWTYVH